MKQPVKTLSKVKWFLFGSLAGLSAYELYIRFLDPEKLTASGLGWIFFAPQYLVLWLADKMDFSDEVTIMSCRGIIALLYGYIFLSFRLAKRTATVAFLVSSISYLAFVHWQYDFQEYVGLAVKILFWPTGVLRDTFDSVGFSNHIGRIFIESIILGFWYAALICGVRTLFLPIKSSQKSQPNGEVASQPTAAIIRCTQCNQQLRVPTSANPTQIRCPACQFTFAVSPAS